MFGSAPAAPALAPLQRFREEWFRHPEWWFETRLETDRYLTATYGHWLAEDLMSHSWDWTKETAIAWVILYDQLPRHMSRTGAASSKEVYAFLSKAIGLVQLILKEFEIQVFTGVEFGFLMLPLRHSYDAKLTFQAMEWTWRKIDLERAAGRLEEIAALKPFLVATYQRAPMISLKEGLYYNWLFYASPAPVASASPPPLPAAPRTTPLWTHGWSMPAPTLTVSLSGGVDSMVLLWILKTQYANALEKLQAVYINYCNRSDQEEAFVVDWCATLGVPLLVRRIREIQRDPAMTLEMREVYETYTKKVRFHTYHLAAAPVVALGHNQDDCFENILTNICASKKYENLRGMTTLMETEGLQLWRPMLQIPKADIYTYAAANGIPHLPDSTPAWSCRGKIRDSVRPTLQSYHPTMVPAFFQLSETLADLMSLMVHIVSRLSSQTTPEGILTVSLDDYPTTLWTSVVFWNAYFQKRFDFSPRHKSLRHLTERLKTPYDGMRVVLKKNFQASLRIPLPNQWVWSFNYMNSN